MTKNSKIALIAGVGEGLGGAIARRFAHGGYATALVARSAERLKRVADQIEGSGGRGVAYVADLREESAVTKLFEDVEKELGPISMAVFNAAAIYRASILDTPADMFEKVWRLTCYAGFLVGREAARHMVPRGHGTLIFTGATASLRGGAQFAAFAAAKGGLRQVAQSMARELGPKGIHVASVIIDGVIDSPRTHERMPERMAQLPPAGALKPEHIAEAYWQLHQQPRDAWTFELDLRPWVEKF
ncbi:MAG: SDR family NAD(P)-dependent oxidoreductase [Betaproteobacteria bacterium]|nr:SDR family NAD(P)-dependent oxidoreductase [Betaproteobacteria bacterium]